MTRNRLFSSFIGLVMLGSFGAGFFDQKLQAQGGIPEQLLSLLRPGSGREIDPIGTYNKVLQEVREKFFTEGTLPTDRRLTYAAIRGMLNALDDPYTRFLDPEDYTELRSDNEGEFEGIGAQLEGAPTTEGYIRISKPIADGPAAKAGIRRRDLIIKVDGRSVVGMGVDQAVKLIRGKAGTTVRLTVKRAGQPNPLEIPIVRRPVEFAVVESKMEPGNVGYIFLAQFNEKAEVKLEQAIRDLEGRGARGMIVDLRGNPGGLLDAAIDISSRLIPGERGAVIIVENGGDQDLRKTSGRKYLLNRMPLVVLVNRSSASASEIVAGAVKDNKAGTVVGTTTFGKGLVQTVVPLEDGSACMITTAKYLNPSGKDINRSRGHRGGVEPDVVVEVTEAQFLNGEDPQLRKALELVYEKIGYRPSPKPTAAAAPGVQAP